MVGTDKITWQTGGDGIRHGFVARMHLFTATFVDGPAQVWELRTDLPYMGGELRHNAYRDLENAQTRAEEIRAYFITLLGGTP